MLLAVWVGLFAFFALDLRNLAASERPGPQKAEESSVRISATGDFAWPASQKIAVSLTYDDALPVHYEQVVPLLNEHGLKATFYLTIKNDPLQHPEKWRQVADHEHELGNHSLFHPCRQEPPENFNWLEDHYDLAKYTPQRWYEELAISNLVLHLIDGKRERTYGNNCTNTTIGSGENEVAMDSVLSRLFAAARGPVNPRPVDVTGELNMMQLGHYGCDRRTFDQIKAEIDGAVRSGKPLWLIYMTHGVGEGTHDLYIKTAEHKKLIEWLGAGKDTIWTAPMVDVACHVRDFHETRKASDSVSQVHAQNQYPTATKWWFSGFEHGFPGPRDSNGGKGEWLDFAGMHDNLTKTGTLAPNHLRGSAWTIQHRNDCRIRPFAGDYVFKGEIFRRDTESHRAYPCIVLPVTLTKPMVNSFMVYLDVDYRHMTDREWISLATWSNGWWNNNGGLHTLSVMGTGKLEMAHINDCSYVGPQPQPDFPVKKWVRVTWYYYPRSAEGHGDGKVLVWQDATLMFRGIHQAGSTDQATFHWGMYGEGSIGRGVMYNDNIQFWTLSAPWPDAATEPPSPYGMKRRVATAERAQ
jgi:sialate O-acetylesterase